MKYFCTYFDRNFIYQGLALYQSLLEHAGEFTIWVLCFDEPTYELLNRLNLPNLRTIQLEDFEQAYPDLLAVKRDRSFVEYYWTATPMLPKYIFNSHPEVLKLAYLDADLFFYSDIQAIYSEWGDGSIYLIPHRFAPEHRESGELEAGLYNVGFVGFRKTDSGLAAIEKWTQQNIEWCYDRIEPGKLGDQKYLHDWADNYSGVVVSQNIGIGAGGWNIMNYRLKIKDENITIDDEQVIMLHLNFVELVRKNIMLGMPRFKYRKIYKPYAEALRFSIHSINSIDSDFSPQFPRVSIYRFIYSVLRGGVLRV
jgi:hypothetical protein